MANSRAIPLSRILTDGDPRTIVAEHDGRLVDLVGFRADVAANAAVLRQKGCKRGLLVTENAYYGAVGFFALMAAGAEAILPPHGNIAMIEALSDAWDWVVAEAPLPGLAQVILLKIGATPGSERLIHLDPLTPVTFFTSGTTGVPKRIAKQFLHVEREAEALEVMLSQFVPAAARVLATVPHQHVYGMSFRIAWPLASGRSFVSTMHQFWDSILPVLGPDSVLVTSPAHLNRLDGYAALPELRCPSLVLSGGAPLTDVAAARAKVIFGVPMTEVFGSTETGAFAWRQRTQSSPPWQPMPGATICSTPEGLISVDAPYIPNGRFLGADRVEMDPDGGVHFSGRADTIVKIEGKRVSLVEIERHLCDLDEVEEVAVIALGDPNLQLAAVVVPSALGARELANTDAFRFGRTLRRALARTQPAEGQPRRWRFVDQLPLGPLGKRQNANLAILFEEADVTISRASRPLEPEVLGIRQIASGVELDLHISPALAYLDGHFPGQPIVPGVALVDWAIILAERHLGVPLQAATKFSVKFRRMTLPGYRPVLTLRYVTGRSRLDFEYRYEQQILTSGSIDVVAAPHKTV